MYFLRRSSKKVIENSLAGPETKMAIDLQGWDIRMLIQRHLFTSRKLEIRVQNAVFEDSLKIEVNLSVYIVRK